MWYPDCYPDEEQPDFSKVRPTAPPPSERKEEDPDEITPAPVPVQVEVGLGESGCEDEAPAETKMETGELGVSEDKKKKAADNARYYAKPVSTMPDQPFAHTVPLRDWIWSGSSRRRPKPLQSSNSDPLPSLDEAPQTLSPSFTPINGPEAKAKKERERRKGRPVYESSEMAWRLATFADEKAQEEVERKVLEWDDGGIDPSQWE